MVINIFQIDVRPKKARNKSRQFYLSLASRLSIAAEMEVARKSYWHKARKRNEKKKTVKKVTMSRERSPKYFGN